MHDKNTRQLSAPRSALQVLESYTNLGPIVDFVVMDLERQGQGQVREQFGKQPSFICTECNCLRHGSLALLPLCCGNL
jgi:hypothetical protein